MGMSLLSLLSVMIVQVLAGRDFYKILGIAKNAKDADIKRAYRKLSREWHPDQNPDNKEEATQMFYDISEAYEVLTDPDKRAKYDLGGEEALNGGGPGGPGGHGFHQHGDPFDQFRTFFQFFGGEGGPGGFPGGGFPGGGGGFHHQQAPQNMYDEKSGVTELSNQNDFNTHINQRSDIVIVDFYSPQCGPCRDLKPEYISIAKTFNGIVKIYAVNCLSPQAGQICKSQNVQNYPTIRMYGDNRSQIDFPPSNDRSAKSIGNWISNSIPDFTSKIDSDRKFSAYLKSAGSKALVLLFSDKKQTPAMFKSLCRSFKTNIACGIILGYDTKSPASFVPSSLVAQVDKTPFLYYMHDPVSFEGEKFKGSMSADILSLFFSRVVSHKSRQVTVGQLTAERGEDCSPADATTCILLLRQPTESGGAVTPEYEVMKRLAERYKSDPVKFFWVDPKSKFVSLFEDSPTLVAYRGKRGKYSVYEGDDTTSFDSVNSWVDNIVTGGSALKSNIVRKARHDEL